MSINWSGIREGIELIEQDKLTEFAKQKYFSGERKDRIALLAEYGVSSKESTKRRAKKTELTQSLISTVGLPKNVASYIAESGEGKIILELYNKRIKDGTLNKNWIPTIIKKVRSTLADESSPQAMAIAAKTALLSSEDMSTEVGQEASLIEAIFSAETFEDFEKVDEKILEIVTAPRLEEFTPELPVMGGLNYGSAKVTPTQFNTIQQTVRNRFGPSAGELLVTNDQGDYTVNPTKIKTKSAADLEKIIFETAIGITADIESGLGNDAAIIQRRTDDALKLIPQMVTDVTPLTFGNPTSGITSGASIFDEVLGDRETGTKVN